MSYTIHCLSRSILDLRGRIISNNLKLRVDTPSCVSKLLSALKLELNGDLSELLGNMMLCHVEYKVY